MDSLEGRTLGPYVIERRLGGGGMASVYLGHHRMLEQPRAIKVMAAYLVDQEGFVQLFYREAKLAARLHHPNVVQIYDVSDESGLPYIVMELLEGRTLGDVIRNERPLPLGRVVHLVRQLADALEYAHAHGVVHRDVKPSNAFVGANDHVTLVDFGIARGVDSAKITITQGIGTPEYMAPERLDERLARPGADSHTQAVDADLYALGVVAYELLAGQIPIGGSTPQATAMAQVQQQPRPLREARPEMSEQVEAVILRQLSKDPRSRLGPPSAFAAALAGAARLDGMLAAAQQALSTGDVERAERLVTEARSIAPEHPALESLEDGLADRRERRQRRAEAQALLDTGDWRAALEVVQWLETAGEPGVAPLAARADALRHAEALHEETVRRAIAEEQAAQRREEEEAARRRAAEDSAAHTPSAPPLAAPPPQPGDTSGTPISADTRSLFGTFRPLDDAEPIDAGPRGKPESPGHLLGGGGSGFSTRTRWIAGLAVLGLIGLLYALLTRAETSTPTSRPSTTPAGNVAAPSLVTSPAIGAAVGSPGSVASPASSPVRAASPAPGASPSPASAGARAQASPSPASSPVRLSASPSPSPSSAPRAAAPGTELLADTLEISQR